MPIRSYQPVVTNPWLLTRGYQSGVTNLGCGYLRVGREGQVSRF
jgi:hypothetical protein